MSWRTAAYRAARPLLFRVDPERIHHRALDALRVSSGSAAGRAALRFASGIPRSETSEVDVLGMRFRNRIGLAGGFDKDGTAIRGWAALGLGFVELGTVTPRPQAGNPRPRLFRIAADEALVNRMGFNNAGADALAERIAAARASLPDGFVVGVNLGRNRDTPDEGVLDDYRVAAHAVADVADYLAINVSSPNTPGLRDLQHPDRLHELIAAVRDGAPRPPIVVKLSPDLEPDALGRLLETLIASPAAGVVLSNTTLARPTAASRGLAQDGGLSGRTLRDGMLAAVERARDLGGARLAIIASGGIGSGADARAALDHGADLVQIWTGLVYAGPGLIGETVRA